MTSTIDGRRASGTAVVARKCIEELLRRQDEFELTFIHYEKADEPIYHHGVREIVLPEFRIAFLNRRFFKLIYYFLTTKDKFDIIQWFQPRLYPFFWLAPAKHIVVWVHGAGDVTGVNRFSMMRHLFNWTLRIFRRKVSAVIAGSEYAKRDIIKHYGFSAAQAFVIHNGVDESFAPPSAAEIASVKTKYELPEVFFLNVARLVPNKNALRTMQAFDLFASESSESISFVNLGATGPERPSVDAFLSKTRYRDRIKLVKFVDQKDLPAFYGAAFALVFPLLNEGFGLPAIEAMACGTPTIISKTASPEITEKETVLVDALNERDIAHGMRLMAEDGALRTHLKERGLVFAKQFSWEETGRKAVEIYKHVMKN